MTVLRSGSAIDVGMVRESNQDSLLINDPLFAVADGMGGHNGGEVASATALEVLQKSFSEPTTDELLEAVRRANAKVWDKAQLDETLRNMGTTLTAMARVHDEETGNETIAIVNVGDSRGYLFRDGDLSQVTTDHSLVEEMVRAGELTAEDAESHPRRNILTRALGVEPTVEADIDQVTPQAGDRFLLCSDGLVRELTDGQIAGVLRRLKNPEEAAKELVNQAKAHGGHDNIAVVIVDVEDEDAAGDVAAAGGTNKKAKKKGPSRLHATPSIGGEHITFRMVLFFAAVLGLLAIAVGSVVWYARASHHVGLEGEQLVIYRGRPEPVLWFDKTLAERTNVLASDVPPAEIPRLRQGVPQPSIEEAHDYIQNIRSQAEAAERAGNFAVEPPPVVPTAPVPPVAP